MTKKILLLISPLLLSGCVGHLVWDDTDYWDKDFPDIRTVPNRECARAPRSVQEKEEKLMWISDLKGLEQEREQIDARNQSLRETAFKASE